MKRTRDSNGAVVLADAAGIAARFTVGAAAWLAVRRHAAAWLAGAALLAAQLSAPSHVQAIAEVNFSTGTFGGFQCSDPAFLDVSPPSGQPNGSGHGVVDVAAGTIGVELVSTFGPGSGGEFVVFARVSDVFTFSDPTLPDFTLVSVPRALIVDDGSFILPFDDVAPTPGASIVNAVVQLTGVASKVFSFTTSDSLAGPLALAPGTYPLTGLSLMGDVMMPNNAGVPIQYSLGIGGQSGGAVDLLDTARLSFDLPPGTSITSAGGFLQQAPTPQPVPQPWSLILVGFGVLGLHGYARYRGLHRRRRGEL